MNIQAVIELINREKGYNLSNDYYTQIDIWRDWWKGFYKPFHEYYEVSGDKQINRKLHTLKMAKKVCEDWAAILLNEKTQIVIEDKKSSAFLQGEDETGGIFGDNDFWHLGNALVEKAFYSGTGAFVVKLDGMKLSGAAVLKSPEAKIRIEYLTAHNIIPLTVRQGRITEAAFVSEIYSKGKDYVYLETHELAESGYKITNRYFDCTNGVLTEQPLPAGVLPVINTGSDIPLFAVINPNIVNTYSRANGLGMSVFAHAIDALEGVDYAFNNFVKDFKLGGKKVFYNNNLIAKDEKGRPITPDDTSQQLFMLIGDSEFDDEKKLIQEYNPELRVAENKDGVQAMLDYLSFKCGFGTKHYQFNGSTVVTATQYSGDKQELIQNASKHYIPTEQALKQLVKGILWAGKEILGLPVNTDAKVTVNFEDSFIIDKESERLRDLQEVREGLYLPEEYRAKWRGESEEEAREKLSRKQQGESDMFGDE